MNKKLHLIATILTCSYLCLFVEYTCIMTDNMRIKKRILILEEGIAAEKELIEWYDLVIKAKKNGPTK